MSTTLKLAVVGTLAAVAIAVPALLIGTGGTSEVVRIEGESFTHTGKADVVTRLTYASGGKGLRLYRGAVATKSQDVPSGSRILVRARKGGGECGTPHMTVRLDDKVVIQADVSAKTFAGTTSEYLAVGVGIKSGVHKFTVTNDTPLGSCDNGMRLDFLALGNTIGCGPATASTFADVAYAACATKLTWTPPSCSPCVDVYPSTSSHTTVSTPSSTTDYRVHLPTTGVQTGGLTITGGRNIIIIGGQINLTPNCTTSTACSGITVDGNKPNGHIYIEGVRIYGQPVAQAGIGSGDAIVVYGGLTDKTFTLQNVRVDNSVNTSNCNSGGAHVDVLQPANLGHATLRIDRFTATYNCQALLLENDVGQQEDGWLHTAVTLKNINLNNIATWRTHNFMTGGYNSGYSPRVGNCLTDFTGTDGSNWTCPAPLHPAGSYNAGCGGGPITLENAYATQPGNTLYPDAFWPETNWPADSPCWASYSSGVYSFPNSPQITGVWKNGLPPGGDYVPSTVAGAAYVSPGYQ